MTPERWQQVKNVFHQALELTPAERSSFLDRACSTDHSLRREVESLLSSDQEAHSAFLASDLTLATLTEGTRMGDYEVQSRLGSGGMGVVYRARDHRLGRQVAIKVLAPFFASDRVRLRRFEQEARAAAALNHPNILAVYHLGTYEDSPYLVSELLEGETLRDRVRRGPILLPEALDFAQQVARGLAAAHQKGIVHRDLKPENLFATRDGQVKILDFGLAKQTHPEPTVQTKSASLATEAGAVMGTVGYMSPEQVRGQPADFRSDIFSFGAILHEMISGQRAFTGESSADVASAILKEDPPRLSKSVSGVPQALEGIVRCCLEKAPEQRFQSAEGLSAALRGVEVADAGGASVSRIWPAQRWRWQLVTSAIVLVVVAVAVLASALYFRNRQASTDSIAVLPFANKTGDSGSEVIGDGITGGLIESLSQVPNLRVMSRSSVLRYKGHEVDPRAVGRELNVRAVLTGSIVQRGDSFVLDAELVNANDNSHVWGQQYERKASDVLPLQTDLALAISDKLRPRLTADAKVRLANRGTSNPEAYSLYIKGRNSIDQWDEQHMKEALAYFQQAAEKDPAYAQAYAGMGNAYAGFVFYRLLPIQEAAQKARAAARRAMELDASVAEAHCALGLLDHVLWEWEESEKEARRCVELNPSLFFAHTWYAQILVDIGKREQGLAEQKIAFELDPISFTSNRFLAEAYYNVRDYDQAIDQLNKMIALEPDRTVMSDKGLRDRLGDCYLLKGEYDKAASEYQADLKLRSKDNQAEALRRAYVKEGFRGLLKAQIQLWSNPESSDDYAPDDVAGNYSMLGDRENAFLWLDRAFAAENDNYPQSPFLLEIKVNPFFDNIRSDPRYEALLRRMGFPN